MRFIFALAVFSFATFGNAQSALLPDAPLPAADLMASTSYAPNVQGTSSSADLASPLDGSLPANLVEAGGSAAESSLSNPHPKARANAPVDADGNPIPLNRQQPQRILGFMPNFRSVSGGAKPRRPVGDTTSP